MFHEQNRVSKGEGRSYQKNLSMSSEMERVKHI